MEEKIAKAVKILNEGGIVIFPTDTAYGIGCRIDNIDGIKRLFELRRRPETQATPVLVADYFMAQHYWMDVPQKVKEELVDVYWPGAVTIVLPCKTDKVPQLVRGGGRNLGLRMPNHELALAMIKGADVPILGPSANFHGEPTPYGIEDLDPELVRQVDFVLLGDCSVKKASTVIDCSVTPWKVLRQGAITLTF